MFMKGCQPGSQGRLVLLVLDSVGIGEAPDAAVYGDAGSNTVGNTASYVGGLELPNLADMGLGNIDHIHGLTARSVPTGCYGRMRELSAGKDTITGHWELAGIILNDPFPVYPQGFPDEVITRFEREIGRKTLGNVAASGTEIIKSLGIKHMQTGYPIVYTSADSVFQVAAHEGIISIDMLYEYCRIARRILTGKHGVGRVIARPFTGSSPDDFHRTENRRDFSLPPVGETVLDVTKQSGIPVFAVGKIEDIFARRGITDSVHSTNNMETVDNVVDYLRGHPCGPGFIFANCIDFDQLYGHRNDPAGYADALRQIDRRIPEIISALKANDLLIITADHGCDPTTPSTDHSREYVPLLVFSPGSWFIGGQDLAGISGCAGRDPGPASSRHAAGRNEIMEGSPVLLLTPFSLGGRNR